MSNSCSPIIGYVTNAVDCDDSDSAIYPGATEVCDGDDNDCDSTIDEGCSGEFAVNDEQSNAMMLNVTPMGNCNSISGDLSAASPSAQAQSVCLTGEDLWYQFVAVTSGVRAQVNSSQNNILIEIQDDNGNLVNIENLQSVPGNEILNFGELEPGETYYVCVRNFNSAQGSGAFSLCLNWIMESTCDLGPGPYQLCSVYKADFTNTWTYTFHFTPVGGGATVSHTRVGSSSVSLASISGLQYNTTYSVLIDAVYTLSNGLGQMETVPVSGTEGCMMIIGSPGTTQVRAVDGCPNTKSLGSNIQTTPHICGNSGYEWRVERVDIPTTPFFLTSGTNMRFIQLSSANGFVAGGVYSIRVRPIVSSSSQVQFGPARCVQIQGNALQSAINEDNSGLNILVYPNPTSNNLFIGLNGVVTEQSIVQLMDLSGREIRSEIHNFKNSPIKELNVRDITAGVYLIRVLDGERSKASMFVKE